MIKRLCSAVAIVLVTGSAAISQTSQSAAPSTGNAGRRTGNITSTGETVPNPGASQSGGTTAMDRGVQKQDDKIQGSICKGC